MIKPLDRSQNSYITEMMNKIDEISDSVNKLNHVYFVGCEAAAREKKEEPRKLVESLLLNYNKWLHSDDNRTRREAFAELAESAVKEVESLLEDLIIQNDFNRDTFIIHELKAKLRELL